MAITRRQFVTRLGALAAAAGMSQASVSKIAEAFAFDKDGTILVNNLGGTLGKPRVVWIHGAECTGCSTSLLGLFEDVSGTAILPGYPGAGTTTAGAAVLGKILPTELVPVPTESDTGFTYHELGYNVEPSDNAMNIVDLVVDVVDLQYHETVMGMGADLAAQWLQDFKHNNSLPFVLVVEGALQDKMGGGAWGDTSDTDVPWCSIGIAANGAFEHDMAETVVELATNAGCAAIIPIGQCATFGGYPGCKPSITDAVAKKGDGGFDPRQSQTGAMGVFDYLVAHGETAAANKVINVPGCPTNPWWFALTVVQFLVDLLNPGRPLGVLTAGGLPNAAAIDGDRRLKSVYGISIHGSKCSRYKDYVNGDFAAQPGDPGCLQKIGCKGPATNSLCGWHGWNGQQPENDTSMYETGMDVSNVNLTPGGAKAGGHCTRAGHPCMACTEKGYPDAFVPFIAR